MDNLQKISALRGALNGLHNGDYDFALSLIGQFDRRGSLSTKQWHWVERMFEKARNPAPAPTRIEVGELDALYGTFQRAKAHLQYPKIRLQVGAQEVALSMPGTRSKYHGKVAITDGKPYGENKWWGAVDEHGVWELPRRGSVPRPVQDLVRRMSEDPVGTAQEYARLTGNCCFCGRHLQDERSTAVGYGPICAKSYGIPWGVAKTDLTKEASK